MSLTDKQIDDTKYELKSNFEKSGLSIDEIAKNLKTSPEYIEQLFDLNPSRLEDTWILRNYLIEVLDEKSIENHTIYRISWKIRKLLVFRFKLY